MIRRARALLAAVLLVVSAAVVLTARSAAAGTVAVDTTYASGYLGLNAFNGTATFNSVTAT